MGRFNRSIISARDQLLIAGIQKHLMNGAPVTFNGVPYTPAALIALFQGEIDMVGAIASAKARWVDLTKADKDQRKLIAIVLTGFREMVRQMFTDASILADFGLTPRKQPRARTPAENVVAAAKRKATRAARHTMGPKQKLEIKGSLNGPVIVGPSGGIEPVL